MCVMRMIILNCKSNNNLALQFKLCFLLRSCRDPGHRRRVRFCISFGWVLVAGWSRAGELQPQGLSHEYFEPNGEPRHWPPDCLLCHELWSLPRGILAAFAGHNRWLVRQQCDNGGRSSTHRGIPIEGCLQRGRSFKHHWMDPSGRVAFQARPVYSPTWSKSLYHADQWQYNSGDWWRSHRKPCNRISSGWGNEQPSHTIGTTTTKSCMQRLPWCRRTTGQTISF